MNAQVDDALYTLKQMGCAGAKAYVAGLLARDGGLARGAAHWHNVLFILENLDARQTREYLVAHLERLSKDA